MACRFQEPKPAGLVAPDVPDGAPALAAAASSSLARAILCVLSSVAVLAHSPQAVQSTSGIAVIAQRWLDPISGQLRGPSAIVISGERVSRIVSSSEFDRASVGSVVDLGRAVALPGLIDAHVHLQIGGDPAANARADLRAGFTTVVDLGATTDAVLRLRDAIAAGKAEGPRILGAGLWVGTKNGVCEFGGIGIADGPNAFRARVRQNVAAGADLTKVCVSGWAAPAFESPNAYEIADDALAAVVDESRKEKRMVVAHAISLGAVKASLRAGVDGLAHTAYLDRDTALELRKRGVFLVPTLTSLLSGTQGPAGPALRDALKLAYTAKVPLVFGTDGGVLPHGQNATEFATLVDAGIPPLEAIRSATINAARAFHLDDSLGAIQAGKVADIIAVEGDPLQDVKALSRVVFVMHKGRVVRRPPA